MRIAIASGKGGTGKTTLATNLAFLASEEGQNVTYLDCDVEEPNGHLFLRPLINERRPIGGLIPKVDAEKCILCDQCEEICQFNAIVCMGEQVRVYPELCHSCGGCSLVCPVSAITEVVQEMGQLEIGQAGTLHFVSGLLNIGEVKSPPLISAVKKAAPKSELEILDAPPGTSCPVIESIRGCEFVLLITEPTPFGLSDLILAVEMVKALKLPFGVVVNRAGLGDNGVLTHCHEKGIKVLAQIPEDRRIAEAYSRGSLICEALPEYRPLFRGLLGELMNGGGTG